MCIFNTDKHFCWLIRDYQVLYFHIIISSLGLHTYDLKVHLFCLCAGQAKRKIGTTLSLVCLYVHLSFRHAFAFADPTCVPRKTGFYLYFGIIAAEVVAKSGPYH